MPEQAVRRSIPSSPNPKIQKKPGAPKAKGAVRAKSGCYTCRIRRKKCDEQPNGDGSCQTCVRLRLQCLGFGAKRPEWMREPDSVPVLREKIKSFLASQGMIKGHSGPGTRGSEQQPQVLVLCDRDEPGSPDTPTLSASSSEGHRSPALHATSYVREPEYPPLSLDPPSYNAPSLHPSAMQDLHHHHSHSHSHHHPQQQQQQSHHHHSQHSSSFVSSRGPSFPNDIMLHPYGPAASNVLPSPNSLVPMSHSTSWLNSSTVYSPTSSISSTSSLIAPNIPTQQSSFSVTYTQDYSLDEGYDEEDQKPASNQLSAAIVPDRQTELVNHYMVNVLKIQYLLADNSISSFIFNLTQTSETARDAVCLLSSLHRHCVRDNIVFTSTIPNLGGDQAHPYDDTDTFYYRLRGSLLRKGGAYNEGEAMACLHVVSSFLFSGGRGDWDIYLNIATKYVQSLLEDPRFYGAEDVIRNCSESTRFIIKTTMWFDVLASVTQMRIPRFLDVYRTVFGPRTGAYIENNVPTVPSQTISMLPIMGCENHIVLAIAEISNLYRWKEAQFRAGTLSIPRLVTKGLEIDQQFLQQTSPMFGSDPYLTSPPTAAYSDVEAREIYQRRRLTNDIFRASARVYLHTVLSGDHPSSPEISNAVTETINCLRRVPQANNAALSRSVVRSVVFGICLSGCLTDQPSQQAFLRQLLEQQEVELVGNVVAVRRLMEDVWARRASGNKGATVNWREVMCEGGRDLLLLV